MDKFLNKIITGDCIKVLKKAEKPFADLIFADPPFNIGYKYNEYHDRLEKQKYLDWSTEWIHLCVKKALKSHGSIYIAIGDEYVAELKKRAEDTGLILRNWIIWHYTFGQQTKSKFARSHTHILYFVKNEEKFTFNVDPVRIFSDRQAIYNDKRANPEGKMPDDVWNEYPRLCGTHHERSDFPCQMPESLLARIIRVSSDEDNWVLDPFSGSGTTAVVAIKLNRNFTGIELTKEYAEESRKRINANRTSAIVGEGKPEWSEHMDKELKWLYHENKVPADKLAQNDFLLKLFSEKYILRVGSNGHPLSPTDIKTRLMTLRKSGRLGALRAEQFGIEKI